MVGILFDLDQTLVDSSAAEALRQKRDWPRVYEAVPSFTKYDGIAEVLAMLIERDVPIGIVTSSPRPYCVKVVQHHHLKIEKLVCYYDTERRKPHPDPILKGIELLGISATQVWAIGDDPKDMESACAAGAHAVGVTWGTANVEALLASGAEHIFDAVPKLHCFLDELTKK
jgi:HAD superfamily hydrolase (TIGR01549 family)